MFGFMNELAVLETRLIDCVILRNCPLAAAVFERDRQQFSVGSALARRSQALAAISKDAQRWRVFPFCNSPGDERVFGLRVADVSCVFFAIVLFPGGQFFLAMSFAHGANELLCFALRGTVAKRIQ